MRKFFYSSPVNNRTYSPLFKSVIIDEYNPNLKSVFIEFFYAILFSHHIPSLIKGAGFFGDRQFFDISSVSNFFNSYFGKILFFFITYFTLHYYVFTTIRKIKLPKVYKNKDIINNNATSKNNITVK